MKWLQKLSIPLVAFFNGILLFLGWMMALYAYPRLPSRIPLWLAFAGQETLFFNKSPAFFIYPVIQSVFSVLFIFLGFFIIHKNYSIRSPEYPYYENLLDQLRNVDREYVLLVLLFFNLVFIHLHRTLILVAHGLANNVQGPYFYSLFVIIILLIPFYNLRKKSLAGR